jgi:hypothetical protein
MSDTVATLLAMGHRLFVADINKYFDKYVCILYIFINMCNYVVCFG